MDVMSKITMNRRDFLYARLVTRLLTDAAAGRFVVGGKMGRLISASPLDF
jgi:hypothetical protein